MIRSRRLPESLRPKLEPLFLDFFIEKHEMWGGYFARAEDARIALLGNYDVLLPLNAEELENTEVLDAFISHDGLKMTLYLADHNIDEALPGVVAIAEKLEGTGIFVAVFYHASHHVSKIWNERKAKK